jgi:hypothetical protein
MDAKRKVDNVAFSQASGSPQMSQYLNAMYEGQGLLIGFKSPVPECKPGRIGLLHYWNILALWEMLDAEEGKELAAGA